MLRFQWSRLRRHCGDGAVAINEAIVGAAPSRWSMGWLNRWDSEMDDRSSSEEVDEGHRAVAVDESSGKRLQLGSGEVADEGGWSFAGGAERLWRPGILNGKKEAMGGATMTYGRAC